MSAFDFKPTFERIAKLFITELRRLMYAQRGVDGSTYAPLAPETIAQKRLISTQTAHLRMIRTKDFVNRAFQSIASRNNLRVFVSPEMHGRELRTAKKASTRKRLASVAQPYNRIAEHQIDTGNSKFFPQSEGEVEKMAPFRQAREMLIQDALKQARQNMTLKIKTELHVG